MAFVKRISNWHATLACKRAVQNHPVTAIVVMFVLLFVSVGIASVEAQPHHTDQMMQFTRLVKHFEKSTHFEKGTHFK